MEQNHANAAAEAPYDFRQYDQIWQRVAPSLSPYPGGAGNGQNGATAGQSGTAGVTAAVQAQPMARQETAPGGPSTPEDLPGAVENPCCMGSAAMDDLAVIEGFIEVELSDRRYYQAFARQAPSSARPVIRRLIQEQEDHARRLMTAYYLITGGCYRPSISCDRIYIGAYCPALRERYHQESCNWMNYIRAAEGTTDPCLEKLFRELGAEELCQAGLLSNLLEQALGSPCAGRRMGV